MIEFLMAKTNEPIVLFVTNNLILLLLIRHCLAYICKKTPWAIDDDLASFFGGAINLVRNRQEPKTDKGDQES